MAENKQTQGTTNDQPDVNEVLKKNEELQAQLEELKNLLLEAQKSKETISQTPNESLYEEVALIPPNQMIHITSLFYGGMTLTGANSKKVRLETFGMTIPVTFEDLTYISSNHRQLAEAGDFFIHNKDAVKALYLQDSYKKVVDKNTIENLITLPDEDIKNIYKNVTDDLKETIIDIVLDGVKRHLRDGEMKYSNRNKIELLSELSGKEIYKLANDAIEHEK